MGRYRLDRKTRQYGRLVSECFNPRGVPKRRFLDEPDAVSFRAARPQDTHLQATTAYRCATCGFWHLGIKSAR